MSELKLYVQFVWQYFKSKIRFLGIYSLSWISISVLFGVVYPSLRDSAADIESLIAAFPPELLASFNISEDFLSNIESFVGGELLTFWLVISAVMFAIQGVNSIGGQINSRIIFVYLTKPIPRVNLVLLQFANMQLLNLISTVLVSLGIWTTFALIVNDEIIDTKFMVAVALSIFGVNVFFSSLGLMLGTILDYSKSTAISIGFAFLSFIISGIASIQGIPELIKFFTPFYYIGLPNIISDYAVDQEGIWSLCLVGLGFLVVSMLVFRNKQIYVQ